eukprot:g1266.t1
MMNKQRRSDSETPTQSSFISSVNSSSAKPNQNSPFLATPTPSDSSISSSVSSTVSLSDVESRHLKNNSENLPFPIAPGGSDIACGASSSVLSDKRKTTSRYWQDHHNQPSASLRTWRKLNPCGERPSRRSGAASVVVGDKMYLFGGYGGTCRLADFFVFDFSDKTFQRIFAQGQIPGPRENNSMVFFDGRLYLFGGYSGAQWLNDFYEYDIASNTWREIVSTSSPDINSSSSSSSSEMTQEQRRTSHGTTDGTDPYRRNPSGSQSQSNVGGILVSSSSSPVPNLPAATSTTLVPGAPLPVYQRSPSSDRTRLRGEPSESLSASFPSDSSVSGNRGSYPSPRFGFVAAATHDHFLVFGGYDGRSWLNDMHSYSFITGTWDTDEALQDISGDVPSCRSCPSWSTFKDHIYVFGGYDGEKRMNDLYKFNINTHVWTKIDCQGRGPVPSPRYFHNSVKFAPGSLLIIGGYNGVVRLNDVYEFDIIHERWSLVESSGDEPKGRSSFVAGCWRSSLFIFGGYNGKNVENALYELRFERIVVPAPRLTHDLSMLIDNSDFSDVVFIIGDRKLHATRAILAARSEHFRALLYGSMKESYLVEDEESDNDSDKDGEMSRKSKRVVAEVKIHDISFETFRKVIEYLYTDRVTQIEKSVPQLIDLLIAAERFMLYRLKCITEGIAPNTIPRESREDPARPQLFPPTMSSKSKDSIELSPAAKTILVQLTEAFVIKAIEEAAEIAENRTATTKSTTGSSDTKKEKATETINVEDVALVCEKLNRRPFLDIRL